MHIGALKISVLATSRRSPFLEVVFPLPDSVASTIAPPMVLECNRKNYINRMASRTHPEILKPKTLNPVRPMVGPAPLKPVLML